MPEAQITPLSIQEEDGLFRYTRSSWRLSGQDDWMKAPTQNQDACEIMLNVLPPESGVIQRRWGYDAFAPKLDTGGAISNDRSAANALFGAIFDGSTGVGTTPNSVTFNYSPTLSFEFWFQTTGSSGGTLVSLNQNSAITGGEQTYLEIYMNTSGNIGAGFYNGTSVQLSGLTATAYNDGIGHHVVVTFNGGTIIIYVDNVAVVTTSGLTTGVGTPTTFIRMAHGTGGTGWPSPTFMFAFVSHLSYWNVVLTPTQVTAHYNAMALNTGSQLNYEIAVENDGPQYFWYLNETPAAAPPIRPTVVQTTSASTSSNSISLAFDSAVTPGNTILAIIYQISPQGGQTISDNKSDTYNAIDSVAFPNHNGPKLWAYEAACPAGGTVTVSFSSTPTSPQLTMLILAELYSLNASPIDAHASTYGTSASYTTPSVTTTVAPDIVFGAIGSNNTSTLQATNGFALVLSQTATDPVRTDKTSTVALAQTSAPTTGAYQSFWNQADGSNFCAIGFALKLVTPSTGSSNNIYDYADSNNGTYSNTGVTLGEFIIIAQ